MDLFEFRIPKMKRILSILGLITIFMTQMIYAKGVIRGKVIDEKSKEALPYANVVVKGTNIGSPADMNGEFSISNAPSGNQIIVISYIGYETLELEIKVPSSNKAIYKEVGLKTLAVRGETVVVTAQGRGQMQAINQQLASDKITSIVSEARIQELPDFNAAEALGRLPGVSTLESSGEANKVVIRGLAPQFNSVSVEGVKLASTGSTQMGVSSLGNTSGGISNDRSVDLTLISPYMVKSMSVFKSLTPDMDANSIGGSVNMELREAPSELHYDLMLQMGYTAKTDNFGNYRCVASVSDRFFGDKLGVYFLVNGEKYDRDADNMSAGYSTQSTEIDTTTGYRPVIVKDVNLLRHVETRTRYGANMILDYKLPRGSIKSVNMFTRLLSDFSEHKTNLSYDDGLIYFNYYEGEKTTDLSVNSIKLDYDFNWLQMDLKYARSASKNFMDDSPYMQFKSPGNAIGQEYVTDNTKPENLLSTVSYPEYDDITLSSVNLWSSHYEEEKNTIFSDFKIPFAIGLNLNGYIKFGGQYHKQENKNNQETPYASLRSGNSFTDALLEDLESKFGVEVDDRYSKFNGATFAGDSHDTRSFLDNEYGEIWYACDPTIPKAMAKYLSTSEEWKGRVDGAGNTGGWYRGIFQTLANTYHFEEDYYASYLMANITFKDLMVVGGFRYEKTESKYKAYNMYDQRSPDDQSCDTVIAHPSSEVLLPQVQAKYSPFDWMDVRYAYTQTIARPDYHQMSPKTTYNNSRTYVRAGNPDLKPAMAYNHDLNLTFNGSKLGLFSIGAFYKKIEDFTYTASYTLRDSCEYDFLMTIDEIQIEGTHPNSGATITTYINNPYDATVKGLEFDFQTRFWYLPKGLDGLVCGINYTRIKSKTKYFIFNSKTEYDPVTRQKTTYLIYETRNGRLLYQPNDVVNAYVGYDYSQFSARLSFLFQGNMVSGIGQFPETDGHTVDYFRVDASVRQKLPWFGSEIFLNVNNLNNAINKSAQNTINGLTYVKHYGMTANMGIRFRL